MSWLMGGGGRNQPSSQEKIAQAEQEMEMISDMFNRYMAFPSPPRILQRADSYFQIDPILLPEMYTRGLSRSRPQ